MTSPDGKFTCPERRFADSKHKSGDVCGLTGIALPERSDIQAKRTIRGCSLNGAADGNCVVDPHKKDLIPVETIRRMKSNAEERIRVMQNRVG